MVAVMTTKISSKRVVIRGLTEQEALEVMVRLSQFHLPEGTMVSIEDEPASLAGGLDPDPPPPPPKKP